MFGLNTFALLVFVALNLFAHRLSTGSARRRDTCLRLLCALLLSFNFVRYTLASIQARSPVLPVEFSTVTYFALPLILLSGRKRLQSWATYAALMAGFFYYVTMIAAGGAIYGTYPPLDVYISLCCHGTLYLCGLVRLRTCRYAPADCDLLLGGVAGVVLRAHLLRPLADRGARLFIYELLDGVYIRGLFPEALWGRVLPVYYILLVCLLLLSVRLFFRLNARLTRPHSAAAPVPLTPPSPAAGLPG